MAVNLEFVTTPDLIKELLERYEHAVFAGLSTNNAKQETRYHRSYVGNPATALGLLDIAKAFILNKFHVTLKEDIDFGERYPAD